MENGEHENSSWWGCVMYRWTSVHPGLVSVLEKNLYQVLVSEPKPELAAPTLHLHLFFFLFAFFDHIFLP